MNKRPNLTFTVDVSRPLTLHNALGSISDAIDLFNRKTGGTVMELHQHRAAILVRFRCSPSEARRLAKQPGFSFLAPQASYTVRTPVDLEVRMIVAPPAKPASIENAAKEAAEEPAGLNPDTPPETKRKPK